MNNKEVNISKDMVDAVFYAVLKLSQDIIYTDPFTKEEKREKINGIAGFIPCFATFEEAQEASCDGKFKITEIRQVV